MHACPGSRLLCVWVPLIVEDRVLDLDLLLLLELEFDLEFELLLDLELEFELLLLIEVLLLLDLRLLGEVEAGKQKLKTRLLLVSAIQIEFWNGLTTIARGNLRVMAVGLPSPWLGLFGLVVRKG